mgnify:FL=1
MKHPPAAHGLVDTDFWKQGRQWFEFEQGTKAGLCLPEGLEIHAPENPLDLVRGVRYRTAAHIVFSDPKASLARMALPEGASAVYLRGKNEAGVDWQLTRNPDGSLVFQMNDIE